MIKKIVAMLFLALCVRAYAQPSPGATVKFTTNPPSGSCTGGKNPLLIVSSTAVSYCDGTSWAQLSSGSGNGFPITLGTTSISSGATVTSVAGLTVNGVLLTTADAATTYLNGTGSYTTPAGGTSITLQTNSVNNSSQTALNLENSAATNGLTLTVTNVSSGNVQLGLTGTLTNAGLANSTIPINGTTCTLGTACTITANNPNALTINNGGSGAASGSTYNGSAAVTLSYNSIGAAPLASPTFTGTVIIPAVTLSGITGSTQCLQVNTSGTVSGTGSTCGSGGGGLSFPATVSGTTTSGGIPYFSSVTTLTSSGLLAAGRVLLGGGAGAAPTSDANLDDGQTAASTLTYAGTGGIVASNGPVTSGGSCGNSTGCFSVPQGTGAFTSSGASQLYVGPDANGLLAQNPNATGVVEMVDLSHTQTLTSKTIDGVTPTTMGFVDPTSSIQTQLNGKSSLICSGTVSLGTSAITSGAAATTVTATCTGLASTDNIMLDFNASPLAVTGYTPSASGMLAIIKWPTTNTINVSVVNNTGSSITPGAITLNYRVVR